MKKQIFTLSLALYAAFGYSQQLATNTFPTSGKAGINTTAPVYSLDVISSISLAPNSNPSTLTFVGNRQLGFRPNPDINSGLLTQIYNHGQGVATRLQTLSNNINSGFIDFNAKSTTNTSAAAISFGTNGSELMRINANGKVRIGGDNTTTPDGYKLFVEQGILTEKVKVAISTTSDWADYVFAPDYKLMSLKEVEQFTIENKHLPNIPSAAEMVTNGLDVAQMDAKLLEKVEELTLYIIEQNKTNEVQAKEIEELKAMVKQLLAKQ